MIKAKNGRMLRRYMKSVVALVLAAAASGPAEAAVLKADFNGDRREDLAVGVPGNSTGGQENAGSVTIFYGASDGFLSANPQQVFSHPVVPIIN